VRYFCTIFLIGMIFEGMIIKNEKKTWTGDQRYRYALDYRTRHMYSELVEMGVGLDCKWLGDMESQEVC
jgi:hypothetical protein